ncbi:FkbM family methyltransferase [Pseudonocardia nigra]|uniref:FkbM family methyltransferase n=1 Tax=Pseudonocardia nigra TaxID=1921578 RepID=UPI001C5FEFEB|nr:FkbM family methyltransferase [Pseudonocardia nigra]
MTTVVQRQRYGAQAAASGRAAALAAVLRGAAALGLAEPELRGLAALVRPGDVCFDIGAAYGMYSHVLAALVGPRGVVHAVEPLPVPSRILRAGAGITGGPIRVRTGAMGEAERAGRDLVLPVRFGLPIHGWAHLGGDAVRTPIRGRSLRLRVPVWTVDALCAAEGIDRVRFLKIDVEGAEPAVLAGAAGTLERCRPTLQLEIEQRHLDRYGHRAGRFAADLRERYGYGMFTWARGGWAPADRIDPARRNYLFATEDAWNA